ncbi:MAG: B12-binding domain-containing radical SAM protein [Desulfobacterales bacterium]
MKPVNVLLVNPPIYDFTAYDFWLRPYGMLRVAGKMQHCCRLSFFNFLVAERRDPWGRGRFTGRDASKPETLRDIPRRFHRFGRARNDFREFLRSQSCDAVLIQTYMTYWYPGIREVIEDVRQFRPRAKIILGGVYATLCPSHAQSLGPDLVVEGSNLEKLWQLLSIEPRESGPFRPEDCSDIGIIKISEGCPFHCTYCAAPLLWPGFSGRPTSECIRELRHLIETGARNIAFYDDALLYRSDRVLIPFLKAAAESDARVLFHTPNALNARFMTPELARLMVQSGFASFFFGLESAAAVWQLSTGGKVYSDEFADAVNSLRNAGAGMIFSYVIVGHPDLDEQDLEPAIRFAHKCGTRVILSEFSPIPGTVDGLKSSRWADLDEPLSHNKTAYAIRRLGVDYLNDVKKLSHSLNSQLSAEYGMRD